MTVASAPLPLDPLLESHNVVKGVAFRRRLVEASIDMMQELRQQQQQQQQSVGSTSSSRLTSSEITDAIRQDEEMSHPNWTHEEMARTNKACPSGGDSRLMSTVWTPPPRQPPAAHLPSFPCPFNLQYQDVISVQHRSH